MPNNIDDDRTENDDPCDSELDLDVVPAIIVSPTISEQLAPKTGGPSTGMLSQHHHQSSSPQHQQAQSQQQQPQARHNANPIVQFNVGGTIFATSRDTLLSNSRLYSLKSASEMMDDASSSTSVTHGFPIRSSPRLYGSANRSPSSPTNLNSSSSAHGNMASRTLNFTNAAQSSSSTNHTNNTNNNNSVVKNQTADANTLRIVMSDDEHDSSDDENRNDRPSSNHHNQQHQQQLMSKSRSNSVNNNRTVADISIETMHRADDYAYLVNSANFFTQLLQDSNEEMTVKDETGAYFIDRNKDYFGIILEFIRSGELNIPLAVASPGNNSGSNSAYSYQQSNQTMFANPMTQSFVQKLICEADFYMIDISSQLYNIVGDGIYVSEDEKGSDKRCLLFFDKDPVFQPCSLFMNGAFRSESLHDKELYICNGSLLMYNSAGELEYVMYPTTATTSGNSTTSSYVHFRQSNNTGVSPGRGSMASTNVIVVRDCKRFNKNFILREAVPPSKILLSHDKAYFNLSDYNHSIRIEHIDSQHYLIIESFKDDGAPVPNDLLMHDVIGLATKPAKKALPQEMVIGNRYTFPRMRPLHGLFPDEDDENDDVPVSHGSSSSSTRSQHDSGKILSRTRMRVVKTNFIAKSKGNFMYIESRNRLYWHRGGKVLAFGLANKSL